MQPVHLAYRLARVLRDLYWRVARPDVYGVKAIVRRGDAVLLIRHSYTRSDQWMLPGGGGGREESIADTAIREVREEAGCAIRDVVEVGRLLRSAKGARNHLAFVAALTDDDPVADGREIVAARFFPLDALPETTSPLTRRMIAHWQSGAEAIAEW